MSSNVRRYREGYVALDNVGLHYLEWGDSGPHVLVLHGATSMAVNHAWFIETLFPNCHIFAPDHRGHGHSSSASSYDLDDFAADTAQFIEKLGIQNPLVLGHSLGGAISMHLFGSRDIPIRKLLLKDIGPDIARRDRPTAASQPLSWHSYDAAHTHFEDAPQALGDPTTFIANNLRWTDSLGLAVRYDPGFFNVLHRSWDLWDQVACIDVPTLIPHGELSDILPAGVAARMVEAMPDARVVEFPGCGHLLEWQQPDRFVKVVGDFVGDKFA